MRCNFSDNLEAKTAGKVYFSINLIFFNWDMTIVLLSIQGVPKIDTSERLILLPYSCGLYVSDKQYRKSNPLKLFQFI